MQGGPRVLELDDKPWFEVSRIRLNDGRIVSINEKWLELSPRFVCFYNKWDPGAMTPRHGHHGDHSILILEGEIRCGDLVARAGSHIMLEYGDAFGPWVAGPEGCLQYGVIMGMGAPFFDRAGWQKHLADLGAEELPVPPPPLPLWSAGEHVLPGPLTE